MEDWHAKIVHLRNSAGLRVTLLFYQILISFYRKFLTEFEIIDQLYGMTWQIEAELFKGCRHRCVLFMTMLTLILPTPKVISL